ncbi:MAG: formylglycine-generating enzyme family protein [Deltaproteobacteria bacterium]|nr:formylglycine-generating enzyme family protein [Deltaproteobacteria bacterium]
MRQDKRGKRQEARGKKQDVRSKMKEKSSSCFLLLTSNFWLLTSCIWHLASCLLLLANPAYASQDDYHPLTGEPKCMDCHTPDRKYSIDYTREQGCEECHGPNLSERYASIDTRYKGQMQEVRSQKQETKSRKKDTAEDMVLVPGGEFTMGSNDWWPKSGPEHKVNLPAFYIDKYEVTNKRFKKFVDTTGYRPPDHWNNNKIPDAREEHPVVYVSWFDAEAFCRWDGKRLPTEAEWEKAARGADKRVFPWGDKFSRDKANTPQYGKEDTMPVASFESGKSPYGVYDMAGNVWEWTADWFKPYPGNTHADENYGEKYMSLRGGSWYDCTYYKCGISAPTYNRIFFNPQTRNNNFGFRCAK